MDTPNERSLHSWPVPRTGGLALLAGMIAGGACLVVIGAPLVAGHVVLDLGGLEAPLSGLAVLAGVSFLDDRCDLRVAWRLVVQLGVAAVLVNAIWPWGGGHLGWWLFGIPFLVWMLNLYNFMDGMDGLAGGMAVFGFGTLATLAWQQQALAEAFLCSLVVGAALGFLTQNLPPARLFMGDTGSTLLGVLAGVAILWFHQRGILPLWLGGLLFSPFIVDATVTLARRVLRGERFWEAHRSHYYQRLVRSGWGHGRTLFAEALLMVALALSVLWAARLPAPAQWSIIAAWAVAYLGMMAWIDKRTSA
ncbi:MAG TPA: glycosyltransferase family 4 protein [Thiotrichales bacterium]|nr:glycosyltransferase family 4 protein [Thiotrichales bacterium]